MKEIITRQKSHSSKNSENPIHSVHYLQSKPKQLNALGTVTGSSFAVPEKVADVDNLHVSDIRGNPRICARKDVEFPPSRLSTRAKGKKRYSAKESIERRAEKRSTLYTSMSLAGNVLNNAKDEEGNKVKNRVCLCRRYVRKLTDKEEEAGKKQEAVIVVDTENHTSKVENLYECDNNWCCPVCSAIHLDRRAKQISKVQSNFLTAGADRYWSTWMITLTIPHYKNDLLADLLKKKSAVMSDFHAHSAIKAFKKRVGWKGYVDSLEVRHSPQNGWHPHHHILGFFTNLHPKTLLQCVYDKKRDYYRIATQHDKKLGRKLHRVDAQKYVYHIFAYLCVKHGLNRPSEEHGVDFKKTDDIEDYLTKQSKIAVELTAESTKTSTYSRSQWEILRDCEIPPPITDDFGNFVKFALTKDEYNYAQYSRKLFCEFASAVKGKAKIHWSPDFLEEWLDEDFETENELGDVEEEDENKKRYPVSPPIFNRFFSNNLSHLAQIQKVAEEDSLNNTNYAEIHLYALKQIFEKEQQAKREKNNEQIPYEQWQVQPPSPT